MVLMAGAVEEGTSASEMVRKERSSQHCQPSDSAFDEQQQRLSNPIEVRLVLCQSSLPWYIPKNGCLTSILSPTADWDNCHGALQNAASFDYVTTRLHLVWRILRLVTVRTNRSIWVVLMQNMQGAYGTTFFSPQTCIFQHKSGTTPTHPKRYTETIYPLSVLN